MEESKRIPVGFRVTRQFKRCLELAAQREHRSQTNLLEKLLFDYCRQEGIEPDEQAPANQTSRSSKR